LLCDDSPCGDDDDDNDDNDTEDGDPVVAVDSKEDIYLWGFWVEEDEWVKNTLSIFFVL
jgi:hypothetical protein